MTITLEDIDDGKPIVYFGDSTDILSRIPKHRQQDVQLIKPSLQPFALNILADKHPRIHSVLLEFLKGFWDYDKTATPNLDMYFRAGIRTAADADQTFLHIDKLLTDKDYLDYVLSLKQPSDKPNIAPKKIDNPLLRKFWRQFKDKSERDRMQETASTRNKLWAFLLDEEICHCVAQKDSKLDFSKVIIVDLDENTSILGIFILAQLYLTGGTMLYLENAHLYGAGVQWLITSMQTMLSVEYLDQFSRHTIPTILGSVDRVVAFRIGLDDYEKMAPLFGLHDLETKPYTLFKNTAMEARYGKTTFMSMRFHNHPDTGCEKKIIRRCKSQYTQPIEKIEKIMREL